MMLDRLNFSKRNWKWLPASWAVILLLAISVAAQQPGTDAQANAPAQRVITGRVTNESGLPLAGVGIYVRTVGANTGQQTSTDGEGNFRAQGLDPGTYQINANLPPYVPEIAPTDGRIPTIYYRPGDSANIVLIKGGVITGTVTNNAGEPLVNAAVRAVRVRDAEGKPVQSGIPGREKTTDDRGSYRIYGLLPGSYIVSAGGPGQTTSTLNPYTRQAPTYAPASTRDTAMEVIVRTGEQVTADIRDRGELGHSISGRINGGPVPSIIGTGVRLTEIESHVMVSGASANGDERTFQVNGISDGEYELSAVSGGGPNTEMSISPARRISVKGADVTGIELTLAPLAAISGRVNIETDPQQPCGRHRELALRETLITLRRARVEPDPKNPKERPPQISEPMSFLQPTSDAVPNDKGEISLRNLFSGVYRVETRTPGAGWYVKTVTTGANGPNIPRDGIGLKAGDRISGFTVTIAEGAARLHGRVSVSEGQHLPPKLRVYLVPAERESAENLLRFFEVSVSDEGGFSVGNIAPGRYLILARAIEETEPGVIKSIKQDTTLRTNVLHEAQALKKELSFKPCEQSADYELPWTK
jgi:hypothetical protein